MKLFQKTLAAVLCVAVSLGACACHPKNETALVIDGITITSAMYAAALVEADIEARSTVDQQVQANATESSTNSDVDYYTQKIDGQNYTDYVKAEAIAHCKEYAFFQKMINDGTLKLSEEKLNEANNYAENYWGYYGASYYEPNGVGEETYKKIMTYSYYSDEYFKSIYGEGGTKAVDKATISKGMQDNFVLADALTGAYEENATDQQKADLKAKYEQYAKRLEKGEAFKTVFEEVNGKDENNAQTTGEQPQDKYATILGEENTGYASADYATVKAMKVGEVKLVESDSGVTVYVKQDITKDPFYLTNLTDSVLYTLKNDEFEKSLKEATAKMVVTEKTFATKQFKIKKLTYATSTQG